jgi:hypothetical protein
MPYPSLKELCRRIKYDLLVLEGITGLYDIAVNDLKYDSLRLREKLEMLAPLNDSGLHAQGHAGTTWKMRLSYANVLCRTVAELTEKGRWWEEYSVKICLDVLKLIAGGQK